MDVGPEEVPGCRLLLVEDNPEVAQVTETMLTSAGYTVVWANSPVIALKMLENEEPFGALLSDIVMEGGLSGLDLAERVQERWPALPVVLMTGYVRRSRPALPEASGSCQSPSAKRNCLAHSVRLVWAKHSHRHRTSSGSRADPGSSA